jgi:excisionase family DNA binding protein
MSGRCDDTLAEQRRRADTGPTVEEHHGLGPRLDLSNEIGVGRVGQDLHESAEDSGMAVDHGAHMGEIFRAAALDHIAGDGERTAGEADQGRRPSLGAHQPNRFKDRGHPWSRPSLPLVPTEPLVIAPKKVQQLLDVSGPTVERLIADGTLESVKIGRARRVRLDSVMRLAEVGTDGRTA